MAKQKYTIAETKEKLELKITELRIEEEGKGENLTKEDLPKLNSDEIDVGSVQNFPVQVIYEMYKFNVDENFLVTYVGEANQTIITYTTYPEGYTNQDEIEILIKVSNPKGIKSIEYPDGDILEVGGATQNGIDYTVTANGTYTFKVIDSENGEVIKDIVIDQIDKLEPLDFTPKYEDITVDGFTIVANAKDSDATETSSKSGIGKYEYYVNGTKYESDQEKYTVTGLDKGTQYTVYVIAYDKAGNSKTSTNIQITTLTIPLPPLAEIKFNESNSVETDLEYPVLTLDGMKNCYLKPNVGENITLKITSKETELTKNYYSIDGGNTWNRYDSEIVITAEDNTDIKVKSKYADSVDSISYSVKIYSYNAEKETLLGVNALPKECYDRDFDTYSILSSDVGSRFEIDPHCWGSYLNVYYKADGSGRNHSCGCVVFINQDSFGGDPSFNPGLATLNRDGKGIYTFSNTTCVIPSGVINGFFYGGYWAYDRPITYEIWCSNDDLAGNVYTNENKPF